DRWASDRLTLPPPHGTQCEHKRIGPARAGDYVPAAAKHSESRLEGARLRSKDKLTVTVDAGAGCIDGGAEPPPLGGNVNESDRRWIGAQIHRTLGPAHQPTTARGPIRCAGVAIERGARQRVAISRLATASSPLTAGAAPERTARRKASKSARSGPA